MKPDYLNGTPYVVYQKEDMFHFGSDTELLGCFMRLHKGDSLLDIGTNNGALLCYGAFQGAGKLTGIDLFEEAIAIASRNMAVNHLQAELQVVQVQNFRHVPFDAIVCNPPYFHSDQESLKKENIYLRAARHDDYLSLEDLAESCSRLLKDNGRIFLVYRPDALMKLIHAFEKQNLHPQRLRVVYASQNKNAKSILIELGHRNNPDLIIERPAFLNDRSSFGWKGEAL